MKSSWLGILLLLVTTQMSAVLGKQHQHRRSSAASSKAARIVGSEGYAHRHWQYALFDSKAMSAATSGPFQDFKSFDINNSETGESSGEVEYSHTFVLGEGDYEEYHKSPAHKPLMQAVTPYWIPYQASQYTSRPDEKEEKYNFLPNQFLCKKNAKLSKDDIQVLNALGPIDIVYTWVNGSDAVLGNQRNDWIWKLFKVNRTFDPQRVSDHGELRHSLRSLWKFSDWFHHVYIITNDQTPDWLNVDHPCLSLVSTDSLFTDKDDAPSFSSVAIEWNMYNIPNLTDHFLYLNDDFYFNLKAPLSTWYNNYEGYQIYQSWGIRFGPESIYYPDAIQGGHEYCSNICPDSLLGDSICDQPCDLPECAGDMGDCSSIYPSTIDIHPEVSGEEYYLPLEAHAVFVDLSVLFGSFPITQVTLTNRHLFRQVKLFDTEKALLMLLYRAEDERFKDVEGSHQGRVSLVFENTVLGIKQHLTIIVREEELQLEDEVTEEAELEFYDFENIRESRASNNRQTKHTIVQSIHRHFLIPEYQTGAFLKSALGVFCFSEQPSDKAIATIYNAASDWAIESISNADFLESVSSSLKPYLVDGTGHSKRTSCGMEAKYGIFDKPRIGNPQLHWVQRNKLYNGHVPFRKYIDKIPFQFARPKRKMPVIRGLDAFGNSLLHSTRVLAARFTRSVYMAGSAERAKYSGFGPIKIRNYFAGKRTAPHMPLLFNRRIIATLRNIFPEQTKVSSGSHFRRADDMQFPYTYSQFLLDEKITVDFDKLFKGCDKDSNSVLTHPDETECLVEKSTNPYGTKLLGSLFDALQECALQNSNKTFKEIASQTYETGVGGKDQTKRVILKRVSKHSKDMRAKVNSTAESAVDEPVQSGIDHDLLMLQGVISLRLIQSCPQASVAIDAMYGGRKRYRSKLINPSSPRNNIHAFTAISDSGYTKTINWMRTEKHKTFVCTNDHTRRNPQAGRAFNNFFLSHFTDAKVFEREEQR
eukprot:Nk52_evm4s1524 gene=Nk52_evmTU4s1524